MSKTISITGKPGSGKSTLIRKLKNELNINTEHLVKHNNRSYHYFSNDNHVYILGKYSDDTPFGGVDFYKSKLFSIDLINLIINDDKDAIIFLEGVFFKKYDYDVKLFLSVTDDVLIKNLLDRAAANYNIKRFKSPEEIEAKSKKILETFKYFENRFRKQGYTLLNNNTDEERAANYQLLLNYANNKI